MIAVEWNNENHTAVFFRIEGRWNWQELFDAIFGSLKMLDEVDHQVVMVLDITQIRTIPDGVLSRMRQINGRVNHKNWAKGVVLIGANLLLRSLGEIFQKVRTTNRDTPLIFVNTSEEANSAIEHILAISLSKS